MLIHHPVAEISYWKYYGWSINKDGVYVAYATGTAKLTHKKAEQKEDLRIQRTRGLILNAFIELVVEKGFAAVTVQDITERAMVNRSTFYRHYLDKFDLVDKYLEQVYELVSEVEVTAENVG